MTERRELLRGVALTASLAIAAWLFPIWRLGRVFFAAGLSSANGALAAQCAFLAAVLLGAALVLRGSARRWLGLEHARGVGQAAFFALPSHVATTWVALAVAFPAITRDLERHGATVRTHAAPLVRITTEGPLLATLLSSTIIAAIFEETFFRGLLWTSITRVTDKFRTVTMWHEVLSAIVPLLSCTLIFALLHADTPGGLGVVRVVSATVLGLVCGLWRLFTKSTVPGILIHAINNLVATGRARGWTGTAVKDQIFGVPAILIVLATFSLMVLGVMFWIAHSRTSKLVEDEAKYLN